MSSLSAQTQIYGILGNPVEQSLSPLIQNALFEQFKINAVYLAFEVDKNSLGLAFEGIRALNVRGVNITIPFKEEAMDFIDEVPEDLDRCIGAINTVVNRGGQLFGYNTDAPGFLHALAHELSFNPEGKQILVLGAGGAARGIVFALGRARAERILIYNRTFERAEGLVDYAAEHFPETEIEPLRSLEDLELEKIDLVVNAMAKGSPMPLEAELGGFRKDTAMYDCVYSSHPTVFLQAAKKKGLAFTNGLGMLAAQGALSFELWTGHKEGVRESMENLLKKCSH